MMNGRGMMYWMKRSVIFTVLLIGLMSCEADDFFKSAARIDCYFSHSGGSILGGRLTIDQATVHLQEIEISGIRSNANDVQLNRSFPTEGGKYSLFSGDPAQPLIFDIPQGIYDRLSFLLYLRQNDYELKFERDDDDDDEIEVDLYDYFKRATPAFLLRGKYRKSNGKTYPFVLIVDDLIRLNVSARQGGNRQLVLEESVLYTALIEYNLSYWFGLITPAMLDAAEIAEVEDAEDDDDDYLIIHKNINQNLYANIVARIEESTRFEID
ncbi:MAG: hypothetical protein JJU28_15020 [Cyclobacteriaceae bacterium]|nr:hypothetical protein [Cyclobacteriaceae bacterium]